MTMVNGLSESQIEQIRSATEDILENVGFRVMHAGALRLARAAGAKVEETSGIVRLPKPLLHELLAQAPSAYRIAGLNGKEQVVGGDSQHCLAIVTDPWVIDYQTQSARRPRLEDIRRHTIIAQGLEDVVAISLMDFPVSDVEGATSNVRAREEHLLHHDKHYYVLPASREGLKQWLEIVEILSQEQGNTKRKLATLGAAVLSPLSISEFNVDILLSACDNGFAVVPTVCPMAGTTAPYSKAASLLLGNAENVFLAALCQMIKPGNPLLYTLGPSVTDMRSGDDLYYTLDKVLWKIAGVQLGQSYGLPVAAECGGTMTYRYDQQNGAEGMLFMLAAQSSKANILAGIGSCYNAIGMSAEMMIIHTAWLAAARFLARGMETDGPRLGVESIRRVGPGGNFLTDDLTLELLRSGEFFSNELLDYSGGEKEPSLLQRAHEKVEEMVSDFQSPLSGKIKEDLRRYFHARCRELEG